MACVDVIGVGDWGSGVIKGRGGMMGRETKERLHGNKL